MKKNTSKNYIEIISLVLFFLVIISSVLVVNIYAKYFAKDDDQDSSTVASFEMNVDVLDGTTSTQILEYEMTPGYKIFLDININGSNNDVKVDYTITIYTLDNLPLEITHDGENIKLTGISGSINPHGSVSIEDILIEWPNTIDNLDYKYSGEIDLITVVVEIEQVD